jgi:hypothetical protein
VRELFAPMTEWLAENVPSIDQRYPQMWRAKKHLSRIVRNILLSVSFLADRIRGRRNDGGELMRNRKSCATSTRRILMV